MLKVFDVISKKHLPIKRNVSQEYYETKQKTLSEEEFNKWFSMESNEGGFWADYNTIAYYESIDSFTDNTELSVFLLDRLLEQQKVSTKKLRTISGIMVFWLACNIIAIIILLVILL